MLLVVCIYDAFYENAYRKMAYGIDDASSKSHNPVQNNHIDKLIGQ